MSTTWEIWRSGEPDGFKKTPYSNLDEMLEAARRMRPCVISMFGPAGTVGSMTPESVYAPAILRWRIRIRRTEPVTRCDECGSDNVKNGRCADCGETEMIATSYYDWQEHQQVWNDGRWGNVPAFVYQWGKSQEGKWHYRLTHTSEWAALGED